MMKNRRIFIVLTVLLGLGAFNAEAAGPGAVILREKDRARTIELRVGQKLLLYLRNPGSGGYDTLPPIFNTAILELAASKKLPPEAQKPRAGDFGQLYYEWQAKEKGTTDIIINIRRPWEKKAPEEYWRVQVRVR